MEIVLLLEDDAGSLALYQRVLGRKYQVLVATTPDEAIGLCGAQAVALFIADNQLNGRTSGVDAQYRAHRVRSGMRMLLVSGTPPEGFSDSDFSCFELLVRAGVLDFLQKPFKSQEFTAKVAAVIEGDGYMHSARSLLECAAEFRRLRGK